MTRKFFRRHIKGKRATNEVKNTPLFWMGESIKIDRQNVEFDPFLSANGHKNWWKVGVMCVDGFGKMADMMHKEGRRYKSKQLV